jgi:hypothetical protein
MMAIVTHMDGKATLTNIQALQEKGVLIVEAKGQNPQKGLPQILVQIYMMAKQLGWAPVIYI